jgi:hypothetical protein
MEKPISKEMFLKLAGQMYDEVARPGGNETLSQIEQKAVHPGDELSRLLMEARVRAESARQKGEDTGCPQWGRKMRVQQGEAGRRLRTPRAEVRYERAYGVCDGGGFSFSPGRRPTGDSGAGGIARSVEKGVRGQSGGVV